MVAAIASRTGDITGSLVTVASGVDTLAGEAAAIEQGLGTTSAAIGRVGDTVAQIRESFREVSGHAANIDESALLRFADLLLGRPDVAQLSDVVALADR